MSAIYSFYWQVHEKTSIHLLYLVQMAVWVVTAISHRFFEERHKVDPFFHYEPSHTASLRSATRWIPLFSLLAIPHRFFEERHKVDPFFFIISHLTPPL